MNRAQRRALERRNRQANSNTRQIIEQTTERVLNDRRVDAMFLSLGLVLHREFGFGQERVMRVFQGVERMMLDWVKEPADMHTVEERWKKELSEEVHIDM